MTYANFSDQGSITQDNLLAGEYPRASVLATITDGNFTRGTVLGKVTADGTYTQALSASTDGSKTPCAILAESVDASTDDKQAVIYLTGEFNSSALIIGTGLTLATITDDLRSNSIFIKTNQPY
ncbi:MAG: head decoration protein [Alphaproteobacteria bacterium]